MVCCDRGWGVVPRRSSSFSGGGSLFWEVCAVLVLEQVMGFGRFGVWLEVAAKVTAFVCSVVDGGGGEVGRPCLVWMDGVLCRGGVAGVDVKWWGDGG
jgi:hypothetical protein